MQTQSKSLAIIIAIPKGMAIILESEVFSMKNRKLLVAGLCGALCLSLAGFTYASAQAADAPKTSAEETAQMSSTDIFSMMLMALAPMAKIGWRKRTMRKTTLHQILNGGRQRSMNSGLPPRRKDWRPDRHGRCWYDGREFSRMDTGKRGCHHR